MKVIIKGFPRFYYINDKTHEKTKDTLVASLWFRLGDNVTVCSNLTGEVLDEWKHVDHMCEPSVKKALEIAAKHNARGIDIFDNTLGFFVPPADVLECFEELCDASIYPKTKVCDGFDRLELDLSELV